jgi:DNA-binding PadR family transcriptional regulator
VSVAMSLLALLEEGPAYGLRVRDVFDARTGGVWPLNVGQVYTTLERLERDGLVRRLPDPGPEGQKLYAITAAGRRRVAEWLTRPAGRGTPGRDELVLKLVMAVARGQEAARRAIQAERRAAVEQLQEYTRLKRDVPTDADLGWTFLLDSLIFQTEARVRWLDACEARLAGARAPARRRAGARAAAAPEPREVRT